MKKFILILLMICFAPIVNAAEWVPLAQNLFLDKSSVQYIPQHRAYKAWVKEVAKGQIILTYNEYNLNECVWRNLDTVHLDMKNTVKKRSVNNAVGLNWINVVPDTNSYLEFAAIKKQVHVPIEQIPDDF